MPYVIQWVEPKEEAPDRFNLYLEEDPFYLAGFAKGYKRSLAKHTSRYKIKKTIASIEKRLLESNDSVEIIADSIRTPKLFVLAIQSQLDEDGKLLLIQKDGKTVRQSVSTPS